MAGRDPLSIVGDGTAPFHDQLEFSASAVKTDLDGVEADSQKAGDLGGGEPMGLVQQDDSSIVIGKKVEAALHACAGFFPLDNFEHGGRRGNGRHLLAGALIGFHGGMAFALAQAIEGCMRSDAVQPTAQGIGIAQRVAATAGAEEGLLGQVFGLGGISQEAKEVAIDSIVVFVEEQARVNVFGCRRHRVI